MIQFVDVISSDSSTSGTSAVGDSDGAGESAVGDSVGAKRGRKRPTMRIGKAVVVVARGSKRIQKAEGEAAVSTSRGSEHKPRFLIPRRKSSGCFRGFRSSNAKRPLAHHVAAKTRHSKKNHKRSS